MIIKKTKYLLFFLNLLIGINTGLAKTVTYTTFTKNIVTVSGDIPSGVTATFINTYSSTTQILGANSMTLTLTGFDSKAITGLTLSMKSNTASGKGYFTMICGASTLASIPDNNFNSPYWYGAWSTSYININPEVTRYTVGSNEKIIIKIFATQNSLYCQSFTLTYEDSVAPMPKVSTPLISLLSGDYIGNQLVTIQLPTDGTASGVKFTTDGTEPTDINNKPTIISSDTIIAISSSTTIKAVAFNSQNEISDIVTVNYNIIPKSLVSLNLSGVFKKNFSIKDTFSNDGIIVTAKYNDGSTNDATSKSVFSGYDMSKMGIQNVLVSYDDNNLINNQYKIAVGLNGISLATPYSTNTYAMISSNNTVNGALDAYQVDAVNGKIINANDDLRNILSWNITLVGDSVTITNNRNEYLIGAPNATNLYLDSSVYKWGLNSINDFWINSNRSFIYSSASKVFKNYAISNLTNSAYSKEYTKAYSFAEGYIRKGLIVNKIATICLPNDVNINNYKGANFFEIVGVIKKTSDMNVDDITGIAINPVTKLLAGKPYIFQAIENSLIVAYNDNSVTEAIPATGLVGNISNEDINIGASDATHWNYVISGNQLHKITGSGQASIANNRAYLDLYGVPIYVYNSSTAKVISLENEDVSGISPSISSPNKSDDVYSFEGVHMPSVNMQEGLYISKGKKYIIK